jgi:hypothetical protein
MRDIFVYFMRYIVSSTRMLYADVKNDYQLKRSGLRLPLCFLRERLG